MQGLSRLRNMFRVPDLRNKILFTIFIIAIFRLGSHIPVPYVDFRAIKELKDSNSGGVVGFLDLFSGGALTNVAVFFLGIMPYITASIIMQLLGVVIPKLEEWQNEGQSGQKKITQWTRYLTVALCLLQGAFITFGWEKPGSLDQGIGKLVLYSADWIWVYRIQTLLVLTTGTMLLMWLGEQITERGIGNGVSLVITIGIVARLPKAVTAMQGMFFATGDVEAKYNLGHAAALFLLLAGVIAGVIAVTQAQRKIPVQYAQRAVGRKVYSAVMPPMPGPDGKPLERALHFASAGGYVAQQLAIHHPARVKTLALFGSTPGLKHSHAPTWIPRIGEVGLKRLSDQTQRWVAIADLVTTLKS